MTKKLIEILKSCPNNQTFLNRIHLRVKKDNFYFFNVLVKLVGNNFSISVENIYNLLIPVDETLLLSFSLSNCTDLEERKINCQLLQHLRKKYEKYRTGNIYAIPSIKLKNGLILHNINLMFLDTFEVLISSRDFSYNGYTYIYDIIIED